MAQAVDSKSKGFSEQMALFRKEAKGKKKFSRIESFNAVASLFEIFGRRYSDLIRGQFKNEVKTLFDDIHRSYHEIHERLKKGETNYTTIECPHTTKIVTTCFDGGKNHYQVFVDIKTRSYAILPFPQRILLDYSNPEREILRRVESVKKKAFDQLVAFLGREEEKESAPSSLTDQDRNELGRLCFNSGALIKDRKILTFSDMVRIWGQPNPHKERRLLSELALGDWVQEKNPLPSFNYPGSFDRFLILSSIQAVEENLNPLLGLPFSDSTKAFLAEKFKNEEIRSDLCYFSADPARFYTLDTAALGRASAPLIRSFQLFHFLKFYCGAAEAEPLLTILLFMKPDWDEAVLNSFQKRKWIQEDPVPSREVEAFYVAWGGMRELLKVISNPEQQEDLFKRSECWDLLFFLWSHPHARSITQMVLDLAQIPNFQTHFRTILAFWSENSSKDSSLFFAEKYREIISLLERLKILFKTPQHLFFDPPIKLTPTVCAGLGRAAENTERFVEFMGRYPFAKEADREELFCSSLREYILSPNPLFFELMEGAPRIGIEVREDLFWPTLEKSRELLAPDLFKQGMTNERALQLAQEHTENIQRIYHFTNEQIFSIYIENFRLIVQNKEGDIWRVTHLVDELVSFCPAFSPDNIYFLFRYHPDVLPGAVDALKRLRDDWAKNEEELRKFVVTQRKEDSPYASIDREVGHLADVLASGCADNKTSHKFRHTVMESLLSAFFPPIQPLTDYFRLTNLTLDGGIRWNEPAFATHLGQLKFILKKASIGIYFNWNIIKGQPVLFVSFFNIKTHEAFSAFHPLRVSAEEISTDERRKSFFSLLQVLAQNVLREETQRDIDEDAEDVPDSWIPCFIGLKEDLKEYETDIQKGKLKREELNEMWDFFKRLKLSYRSIFLSSVANRRLPEFRYKPQETAALGHIFNCHPRGSLLPPYMYKFVKEKDLVNYIPDANPDQIGPIREHFLKAREEEGKIEPLPLKLKIVGKEYPIFCQIESAEQITRKQFNLRNEDPEESKKQNEVAPPRELTQGIYVTLRIDGLQVPLKYPPEALNDSALFGRYFDYHNLIAKAATYRAASNL